MSIEDLPPFLTVAQVQELCQLSRTQVYEQTTRYRVTGGTAGIPVVEFGRCLRIPKAALLRMALLDEGDNHAA